MSTALLILLAVLQAADIWTTYTVITKQGGRELNPVLAWLFARFGLVPTLVAMKAALLVVLWLYVRGFPLVLGGLALMYVLVVIHNWRQFKR